MEKRLCFLIIMSCTLILRKLHDCIFICQIHMLTGLFTADQKLAGQESIYTRQNPTGTRRGYECPEERDYYPYWHPTEWKDIAILTSDTSKCEYYKKHSFNVEPKGKYKLEYLNC